MFLLALFPGIIVLQLSDDVKNNLRPTCEKVMIEQGDESFDLQQVYSVIATHLIHYVGHNWRKLQDNFLGPPLTIYETKICHEIQEK